jgi:hypothetical protein
MDTLPINNRKDLKCLRISILKVCGNTGAPKGRVVPGCNPPNYQRPQLRKTGSVDRITSKVLHYLPFSKISH